MSVKCGNRKAHGRDAAHHGSVAEVRRCFTTPGGIASFEDEDRQAEADAERRAEEGYERWLEDGGSHAAALAAEDEVERRMELMDLGLQSMLAEREMQRMEAEADREQTAREEQAKWVAKAAMERRSR